MNEKYKKKHLDTLVIVGMLGMIVFSLLTVIELMNQPNINYIRLVGFTLITCIFIMIIALLSALTTYLKKCKRLV